MKAPETARGHTKLPLFSIANGKLLLKMPVRIDLVHACGNPVMGTSAL
jgi:hypothetical protein